MDDLGLVYIGKIISLEPIEGADLIVSASVVCGKGGKWRGVVRKSDFVVGSFCTVFLPDSLLDKDKHSYLPYMEKTKWRVRMCRFKGAPSEVLITKCDAHTYNDSTEQLWDIGLDVTSDLEVKKYHKPVPANLQGKAKGEFPGFIPKTDEPNYQNSVGQEYIELLEGKPYYIAEKADGSSTTAFKYKGQFGLCSRNWELERDEKNGYWEVAIRYNLEEKLPEGIALQWETCGPKIQSNPMGLNKVDGFAFSAYNISKSEYLDMRDFINLCEEIGFPTVKIESIGNPFKKSKVATLGEGKYSNGNQREGVVVRSQQNLLGHKPISFKVINLNYEK